MRFAQALFDTQARLSDFERPPGRSTAWAGLGMHQLRYVLAAAEHGGFRRAARRLGVQQSAVSRRIRELEERLGAQIFERGPSGVRLTQAGCEFVAGARGAMTELDRVVDVVSECGRAGQGVLRIGVVGALGPGPLEDMLRQALCRDPGLALEIIEGDSQVLAEQLAQGRLDVAFQVSMDREPGEPAWRERVLLALPVGHELQARASIRWTELSGLRVLAHADPVLRALLHRRSRSATNLSWVSQAASAATVLRLVSLGQGVALVSEANAAKVSGVVYRPIFREFLSYRAVTGRGPTKSTLRRLLSALPGRPPTA